MPSPRLSSLERPASSPSPHATGFRLCLPSEMSLDPTLLSFLGDTHLELSLSLAQRPTDPAWGLLLCSPPHCCSARSLSFPEAWVPGQVPARSGTGQVPSLSLHSNLRVGTVVVSSLSRLSYSTALSSHHCSVPRALGCHCLLCVPRASLLSLL